MPKNSMLTIDCKDVLAIQNELVVYVADQVAAIPTLKNHQFTLSTLDDDIIDIQTVIASIKEYLDSIGEGHNFGVVSSDELIMIQSISGKTIDRDTSPQPEMFACSHCGFVTRFQVELNIHMRIHYL